MYDDVYDLLVFCYATAQQSLTTLFCANLVSDNYCISGSGQELREDKIFIINFCRKWYDALPY